MSKKDEALEMAQELRALADRFSEGWHDGIKIDALDIELLADAAEALAEQPAQQQEPVACDCKLKADECDGRTATFHPFQVGASCTTRPCERTWTPQPASKPWVGLTDEERGQAINANFGTGLWAMAKDIEAKLREKNA